MSLTSLLSIPEINKKFSENFPKPTFNLTGTIKAPPLTPRYSWIGTAFDYLFRFIIERENLGKEIVKDRWVAQDGLSLLNFLTENKKLVERAKKIFSETRVLYNQYIKTGIMNMKLIENSLFLAQLDVVYRANQIVDNFCEISKIKDVEKDIEDLKNLIKLIPKSEFKAEKLVVLNPTFGKGSELVGGADADLIIDDKIIEIKTTKYSKLNREHLNQLIGYFILYKINKEKVDGVRKKIPINKLGVYFSRYGTLFTFNVKDVIDFNKLDEFIKWFKKKATAYYIQATTYYIRL